MSVMRKKAWSSLGFGLLLAITLSSCGTPPAPSGAKTGEPTAVDAELVRSLHKLVQSLHRQIRARDKRIAELTSQMEALKVIDQDMKNRRKSSRSPATLTPID